MMGVFCYCFALYSHEIWSSQIQQDCLFSAAHPLFYVGGGHLACMTGTLEIEPSP